MKSNLPSQLSGASLDDWLSYLESIHTQEIDLGLARISQVAQRLNISLVNSRVITVAGTNGKGTTCTFLENAFLALEQSVAVYSSPHIERFNERLRLNKVDVNDAPLIKAFEQIEVARGGISLTYYEYTTLAALMICQQEVPDVVILEVGLGGRLDATNIIDADIAVITSIDLDHQAFLGDTKELIGFEKAGIMRADREAVVGEPSEILSIRRHVDDIGAHALFRNEAFNVVDNGGDKWSYQSDTLSLEGLIQPSIPQDNVATAITVLSLAKVPLTADFTNEVISQTKVAGRTELIAQAPQVLVDVAHNPHAVKHLAKVLTHYQYDQLHVVLAMLHDKDIKGCLDNFTLKVTQWNLASLDVPRGATAGEISQFMSDKDANVNCFDNVEQAFKMAKQNSKENDLILVFGSFFTVAEVRKLFI